MSRDLNECRSLPTIPGADLYDPESEEDDADLEHEVGIEPEVGLEG
ncbi:hypothetical protein [Novosphingobium sp. 9]|nr:hypothetical protein [Novosphingobium sp. 9]